MKKKWVSLFLAAVLCRSLVIPAAAAEEENNDVLLAQ